MADVAVEFLLQNLKEILIYNVDLIGGLEDNVKSLCNDLATLKAFLKQYTARQQNNDLLKALFKQIRNVVDEAEDAIETFLVEASIHANQTFAKKVFHGFGYSMKLRRVAKEIEGVREKVRDIMENKTKFGLEILELQIHEEDSNKGRKEKKSSPSVEVDNVIGFDDEAKKVIELLTGEAEKLEVISITGMTGLGKTTLAKMILNDPMIECEFNTRAFVYVSQDYDRREVFLRILGALTELTSKINMMSDDMLVEEIRAHLSSKKYLFVIDDICSTYAWDNISAAFPNNNKSSRLLITSPNRSVALHASPFIQPHDMQYLNFEYGRKLLRRKVFGDEGCPPELEEYESVVLQKCGGVPQAIVGIAGILVNNRTRTYWWKKVAQSVNDYFTRTDDQSNDLLTMSYNHLPFHLKPCFLYLGVFREDYEIPVWKLIRLWISEGFIQSEGEDRLEDIAEDYLQELVDKDFVMVGKRSSDGRIKTCRIRGALREFCKKVALEENLFQEVKRFEVSDQTFHNYRRLCVNSSFQEYLCSNPSGPHVRSLLSFAKDIGSVLDAEQISSIVESFKLLRVMEIKSINFTSFPSKLCDLVLLKYLCISGNFDVIPEELSKLWNIQTIIIETSTGTIQIEADVWKMLHLRHLHTKASANVLCPPPQTNNTGAREIRANLQTISTISPQSCRKDVFDRTPNLKKLGVRGKLELLLAGNDECSLFESIYKLDHLENLKLYNDDPYSKLHAIPHQNVFPTSLKKLTLFNTRLDWKFMSTIAKFHNLEVLKLKENAFQGEMWVTEDGGFHHLKVLVIGKTNLLIWRSSAHHFPILTTLVLKNCNKLEVVPLGLAEISTFEKMEVFYTSASVVSSAMKIKMLKLELQAQQQGTKGNNFQLSVYPQDQ